MQDVGLRFHPKRVDNACDQHSTPTSECGEGAWAPLIMEMCDTIVALEYETISTPGKVYNSKIRCGRHPR